MVIHKNINNHSVEYFHLTLIIKNVICIKYFETDNV